MNWLNNLKITKKLTVLIVGLLVAVIGVGGTGYYFLSKANDALGAMYNEKLIAVELLLENRTHARKIEANTFALMLETSEQGNKALMDEITQRDKQFDSNLNKLESIPLDTDSKKRLSALKPDLQQYRQVRSQVLALAVQNKNTEAYILYNQQGKTLAAKFTDELRGLSEGVNKSAAELHQKNDKEFAFANMLFAVVVLASVFLGVLLGWLIARRIIARLKDVVQCLEVLATGDFSRVISQDSLLDKSEFGEVSRAVDNMKNNIQKLVKQLAHTSEQMAASSEELTANAEQSAQASNQVAVSVTDVAAGSEKQLELTESAANVVQQISHAIGQVAVNTESVTNSAEQAATAANSGEQAIKQAINQMSVIETRTNDTVRVISELEEKSQQIGQIVDVISSISGQTNLLALNAAIEAARAGEAGRGFAVVAEEVRKLAEQSQEAASQITELIGEVQAKTDNAVSFMNDGKQEVDTGAKVVAMAGSSFEEILGMVRDMSRQIHEISAAVQEVTSGTHGIVQSVQEINVESKKASEQTQNISAATEEQSASVEEIASASQHLAKMAEELQQAVGQFKV